MTSLQRFDPYREMRHLNRMMNHPFRIVRWPSPIEDDVEHANKSWSIPMDVRRDDQALIVSESLPGFAADDVDVSISPDRVLSVKASRQSEGTCESEEYLMRERRTGSFSRAIRLPSDLKLEDAIVSLENGVLTVTAPVAETGQTRRLHIASSAGSESA